MTDAFEEFGPYLVYERLGQGGMATVHRAEKRGALSRRPLALKRLLKHVAADPELVKLFVDEARLAVHLCHANVAQIYDFGKVNDTFFLAMEFAPGPNVAQILRQCQAAAGAMPLNVIIAILGQVCVALDYAHNLCDESGRHLHIIHRDVSPANIVVTNTGLVKLIDFGIAKAATSSSKTQTGTIKGKFGYIAPEYISGQLDARADLFGLGVVAHEMMTGRRLFEGKDDFETFQNLRRMTIHPPSRWNPHVTPDLDDIVMTALQRDPELRWQSAGAMQVALANAARGFGLVVGDQQLAEWVDWAFSQLPPGSSPGAEAVAHRAARGVAATEPAAPASPAPEPIEHEPDSSLSIRISTSFLESPRRDPPALPREPVPRAMPAREPPPWLRLTRLPALTPPQALALATAADRPAAARPASRRLPSEHDETVPLDRIELSRGDIELITPSPELAPPPPLPRPDALGSPPPVPRSTRPQPAMPDPLASTRSPFPGRPSRSQPAVPDALGSTRSPLSGRPSRMRDAAPDPLASTRSPIGRSSRADDELPDPFAPPRSPPGRSSRADDDASDPFAPPRSPPGRSSRAEDDASDPFAPPRSPLGRSSRADDDASDPFAPPAGARVSRSHTVPEPSAELPAVRFSRGHSAVADPSPAGAPARNQPAVPPHALRGPSLRELQNLGPPPSAASSRELDVLPRPPPRRAPPEFLTPAPTVPRVLGEMPGTPSIEPAAGSPHAARARRKSTQRHQAQPPPRRPTAARAAARPLAPRTRYHRVWLILLMVALGAAAAAATYYWPAP